MAVLECASRRAGYPKAIRLDNGPEFISKEVDLWAFMRGVALDETRRKCEAWRRDYNTGRPHSAIGYQVPALLHLSVGNPGQLAVR